MNKNDEVGVLASHEPLTMGESNMSIETNSVLLRQVQWLTVLLCLMVNFVSAKEISTDELTLKRWTESTEKHLLENYPLIRSSWFEKACLGMAEKMRFEQIKQCRLLDSKHINAYVLDNGHVYFSLRLMKQIRNEHQWAAILAHENAHIVLNHYMKNLKKIQKPGVFFPKTAIKKMMKKHEKDADQWSEVHLKAHGFDTTQVYFLLKRIKSQTDDKKSSTHLKPSKRIKKSSSQEIIDMALMEKIAAIETTLP